METQQRSNKWIAFALAATGVVMFSAKAIFVKKAYEFEIDTVSLLLIRMTIALPVYIVIAFFTTWRKKNDTVVRKDYVWLVLLGFVGYYMASFLDFHGLQYITASLERLILFVYPTLVLLISAIFLKKAVTTPQKLAIAITYVGVLLAFYNYGDGENTNVTLGAGLVFASALTYAFFMVGSGNLIPKFGSIRFTSYAMIVSCMAVILHFVIKGEGGILGYPRKVYEIGAAMAFVSTIVPSFMIGEAIRRIGASNVAIIGSLGPISTIIMAYIFLGEQISAFQFLGTLIVISGVSLIAVHKKKVAA